MMQNCMNYSTDINHYLPQFPIVEKLTKSAKSNWASLRHIFFFIFDLEDDFPELTDDCEKFDTQEWGKGHVFI